MEGFGSSADSDGEEDEEEEEESSTTPTPGGDHEGSSPAGIDIDGHRGGEEDDDDDFAVEEEAPLDPHRLSKTVSHSSNTGFRAPKLRRMSSPIGMRNSVGPGGSEHLSNGLGQSNSGFGAGGNSYT